MTEVRISPDLKHADGVCRAARAVGCGGVAAGAERATPFLRGQVAHALRLKFAPELTFQPDHALEYATKIDRLLHIPEVARDLEQDG